MLPFLRSTTLTAVVAATAMLNAPVKADAGFNVDCAMLLCLAGGWPKSTECTLAYATFIRRVTPWPIEPPLQIWRCPLGASYESQTSNSAQRLYDAVFPPESLQSYPQTNEPAWTPQPAIMRTSGGTADRLPEGFFLHLVQKDLTADRDISDSTYDFVRSIHVFDVNASQMHTGGSEGGCTRSSSIRIGSYGNQGDYHWRRGGVSDIPAAHSGTEGYGRDCPSLHSRSIFVEWRDYSGRYGYEQVNY